MQYLVYTVRERGVNRVRGDGVNRVATHLEGLDMTVASERVRGWKGNLLASVAMVGVEEARGGVGRLL